MKPYDPEHKDEFCTRDGLKVTLWETRMRGAYSLAGVIHRDGHDDAASWSEKGEFVAGVTTVDDIMRVIPKREALIVKFDEDGCLLFGTTKNARANATFREVMPDDISQEKARALVEAAREVVSLWTAGTVSRIDALRAALGDDA